MALMTKEAYLSSIRKLDHRVFIQGEKVENIPDHPISGPPVMAYIPHWQPYQDHLVALQLGVEHWKA